MKHLLFLGCFLVLFARPAAASSRIVQTASAKTPYRVCSNTACNSSPDELTVSFSPTVAGDAIALFYVGSFRDPFAIFRTCTDSRGQQWINRGLDNAAFGIAWYSPAAGSSAGLTSVTCRGGITGSSNGGSSGNGGGSSLPFFEVAGVSPTATLDFRSRTPATATSTNCGTDPPGGLDLFLLAAFGENFQAVPSSLTFTPTSPGVRPLLTVSEGLFVPGATGA